MPARQPTTALTLGFFGTGAMDVDQGMILLQEFINARVKEDDRVHWVFVLTSDEFTETLREYAALAKDSDIPYEVITKPDDKNRRALQDVAADATHSYNVVSPLLQMEQILREAPQAALAVLWDEDRRDEIEQVVTAFLDAEIPVHELTDGMTPMDFDETTQEATVTNIRSTEPDTTKEGVYSRTDLKEMSMVRLKEVTVALGNQPRKSREQMITEILAKQSGEMDEDEAEVAELVEVEELGVVVEEAEATEVVEAEVVTLEAIGITEGLEEALDRFSNGFVARLSDVFDTFLTDLGKTLEGVAFNLTPEAPAPVEPEPAVTSTPPEPPRRRLRRG